MGERGRFPELARRMTEAAKAFLATLDAAQQATARAAFDVADHTEWRYLPGQRPGLPLYEMSQRQQTAALDLLDTGCGVAAAQAARGIIDLDTIPLGPQRAGQYWFRVLGDPSSGEPWAWRANGHHLAVHLTIVGDSIAVTPQFFGAEPAVVLHGPKQGLRTLPNEEEYARSLLARLDADQRRLAIVDENAPDDIRTRFDPVADRSVVPAGLPYARMSGEQRELLHQLVRLYFDRAPGELADSSWQAAVDVGLDAVTFGWAGSDRRGQGHYYAVRGETFLLEYDNTQDDANHIHSVWRDLRADWGTDLLATHYADHHHGHASGR